MNVQYFFGDFPEINLGDIVLRQIKESDAQDYLYYMNHDSMEGFLTKENRPDNMDKALEEVQYWGSLFSNKQSIYWAIALKENNIMIFVNLMESKKQLEVKKSLYLIIEMKKIGKIYSIYIILQRTNLYYLTK